MKKEALITHSGTVGSITPATIEVHVYIASSCAACHAKGFCSVADGAEKTMEIVNNGQDVKPGERVRLVLRQRLGLTAVWWGYLLPLCLLLIILLLLQNQNRPDIYGGGAAVGGVVLYYSILRCFKKQLKKKYVFEIEKINR
jgi:sigma-E factor negative regulatory protein RseC